ncbi:hypothetical protein BLA29_012736 [Euroglyphus maynei]|uniref:Uncharacterized protein n=1 Tax=Euroglyphus maynei TaxID=6958 RepID=A0A1Y3BHK4_EURMA|nr:hypothetical protein BLA29_012736 [Euroglyphus maynei]
MSKDDDSMVAVVVFIVTTGVVDTDVNAVWAKFNELVLTVEFVDDILESDVKTQTSILPDSVDMKDMLVDD